MTRATFRVNGRRIKFAIRDLVLAGWSGRYSITVQRHISELQAIGVVPLKRTHTFYRVTPNLLTIGKEVGGVGSCTSGEMEFVLVATDGGLLVRVGSDHTDRSLVRLDITAAKQVCPKPISPELWPMEDVMHHWDQLILRCWSIADRNRTLFQERVVSSIRHPEDLIREFLGRSAPLHVGTALFGGSIASRESISSAQEYAIELQDPLRTRSIRHKYIPNALSPRVAEVHLGN